MEVHKHPHNVTHPKKWTEYFLEFLMIFLAVTLGFIAENIHEHSVEVKATNRYLRSFHGELLHHKNLIHYYDSLFTVRMPFQDSMVHLFYGKRENENLATTARLVVNCKIFTNPALSASAYEQIVNAGGLKNIESQTLKDSMSYYVSVIGQAEKYNSFINSSVITSAAQLHSLEDLHDLYGAAIPQIDAYPTLTERERRSIISHYRVAYIQSSSNKRFLKILEGTNERLLKALERHLN